MNRPGNPFPGMNPFFEQVWPDIHTRLIGYISDTLNESLPEDLVARTEEALTVSAMREKYVHHADVAGTEFCRQGIPPAWTANEVTPDGIAVATPVVVTGEQPTARRVEIHTIGGELVTVLELHSPSSKGSGRADYRAKQQRLLQGRVNVVEIDLLRGGDHAIAVPKP